MCVREREKVKSGPLKRRPFICDWMRSGKDVRSFSPRIGPFAEHDAVNQRQQAAIGWPMLTRVSRK